MAKKLNKKKYELYKSSGKREKNRVKKLMKIYKQQPNNIQIFNQLHAI